MKKINIKSNRDGLDIEIAIIEPVGEARGIVQISHGMAEHKERYYDFMKYLVKNGYIVVIHDHRGHGKSILEEGRYGNFYTRNSDYIVDDLYQVTRYIKDMYKDKEVVLFSHSMGTLVVRNYIEKYDDEISKLILCGPPTRNGMASLGLLLGYITGLFYKDYQENKFLDKITFMGYNSGYVGKNEWLCSDKGEVDKYNNDKLCGYVFTTSGFINLYKMMIGAFKKNKYMVKNKDMDILVIAGSDDPVIQNEKKFNELVSFLNSVGYSRIESKLYEGKRHELINETNKEEVYRDILEFIMK